jgi:nucleotide-binding universal stress UspA family protein
MPDTIIVGVDTRRPSDTRDAIALAARLAPMIGAELLAVTVVPPSRGPDVSEHERDLERVITLVGQRMGERPPFEVRAVLAGSAARVLHELAERMEAAAVVIGPSLRDPERGWMAGSVAELLLHGGGCPLAIAPRGLSERAGEPVAQIGVGFVDTDDARSALQHAARLAARAGVKLRVITVVEPFLYSNLAMAHDPEGVDVERALEARARAAVEKAVAALPATVAAESLLLDGSPIPTLTRLSGELDLLVLGSRGYGAQNAVLLGPVSRELVRRPVCPVMVVPRAAARDPDPIGAGAARHVVDRDA